MFREGDETDPGKGGADGSDDQTCRATEIEQLTTHVRFPINITTGPEISSMNNNNPISEESLRQFQQWKLGLNVKECWLNDEVSFGF